MALLDHSRAPAIKTACHLSLLHFTLLVLSLNSPLSFLSLPLSPLCLARDSTSYCRERPRDTAVCGMSSALMAARAWQQARIKARARATAGTTLPAAPGVSSCVSASVLRTSAAVSPDASAASRRASTARSGLRTHEALRQ